MTELHDPAGVFDRYSGEQRRRLRENMHAPILEVRTEWRDGRVGWYCHECEKATFTREFYGTVRCKTCMKIMQSENWEVGDHPPNPEETEPTVQTALSW